AQAVIAVRAEHDRVDVARGDASGVLQRFSPRDLALRRRQRDRTAAELPDGGLERDAGARGRFLEEEQQRAALERPHRFAGAPLRLQLPGAAKERAVLVRGEIGELQEIAFHSAASFSSTRILSSRGIVLACARRASTQPRSDRICASIEAGPVPPSFRLRATDAAASAARSTSAVIRGSTSCARARGAFDSAIPRSAQARTSAPVVLYALLKGTPVCASASATSVAAVAPSSSAARQRTWPRRWHRPASPSG